MTTFRIKEAAGLLGVRDDTLCRWADGAINVSVEITGRLAKSVSHQPARKAKPPSQAWVSWSHQACDRSHHKVVLVRAASGH
jgi:hypothetical protein